MLPFKPNKRYTSIALYAGAVCAITVAVTLFLFRFTAIKEATAPFFEALSPLLFGCVFAYLLRPLVRRLEILFYRLFKKKTPTKLCAIALSFAIVFTAVFLFIFFLLPALAGDTGNLGMKLADIFVKAEDWISKLIQDYRIPTDALDNLAQTVARYYSSLVSFVVTLLQGILSATYKIFIGIILSAAILFHRDAISTAFRRFSVAVFSNRVCHFLQRVISYADHTFGKYLVGKIVEALIIGTIYLIILPLIGMPYPYLVAVIMVITNFIPVVGAYIGGIPCGILILTENPAMVLWFIVICLGVEQIDGNIVAPRVIGSILGLKPVWIMVSVALFGGLFGIIGMFLSAPIFSVLYMLVRDFTNTRLKKKGRSIALSEYEELFASQAAPRRHTLHGKLQALRTKKEKSDQNPK